MIKLFKFKKRKKPNVLKLITLIVFIQKWQKLKTLFHGTKVITRKTVGYVIHLYDGDNTAHCYPHVLLIPKCLFLVIITIIFYEYHIILVINMYIFIIFIFLI